MKRYFALHLQSLVASLGRLMRQPIASFLTGLVISIALALPAGLRVLVNNADVLSASWEGVADFTVYLDPQASEESAAALAAQIEARNDVVRVELITRDDALEEFRRSSGFGDALDALDANPLPHTLVVRPSSEDLTNIEGLKTYLESLPETDIVQLDTEWVARLRAMLELGRRFVDLAGVLLGLAVLVVIGNTIRLEINNRREEIVVMKLVGGSDGFIRRPFLYVGLWYGVIGACGAAALIGLTLLLLGRPVADLAALYGSRFALSGLSLGQLGLLLAGGAALGLIGAALATARHLRSIEPT
jgi:cell division transport system permease protein